jgi:hypothetical protein
MKKTYTITLDPEKVDRLKEWLEIRGLSFSGYLNSLIDEQIAAIEIFSPSGGQKKVSTVQLLKMAGKMVKKLNESEK